MVPGRAVRVHFVSPRLAESGAACDCKIDFHFCGSHPSPTTLTPGAIRLSRAGPSAPRSPVPGPPAAPGLLVAAAVDSLPSPHCCVVPKRSSVGVEGPLIAGNLLANGSRFLGCRMIRVGGRWQTAEAHQAGHQ